MKTFTTIILALSLAACSALPTLPAQPTETPLPVAARTEPELAVIEFIEGGIAKDSKHVAAMYSNYSLRLFGYSRDSMRLSHESQAFEGYRVKRYKIVDTKTISPNMVIVNTVFTGMSKGEDFTQSWSLVSYLEDGHWRINAYKIVDKLNLTLSSTTVNSVTVQPVAIERYADSLKFTYPLSNGTGQRLLWGWGSEPAITFTFADGTQSSVPFSTPIYMEKSADAESHGGWTGVFAEQMPIKVEVGGFRIASAKNSSLPDEGVKAWSYSFDVKP